MIKFRDYYFISIFFFAQTFFIAEVDQAQGSNHSDTNNSIQAHNYSKNDQSIELLLSRLDLNRDDLSTVRSQPENPSKAAEALLQYYRQRGSVKHPVNRIGRSEDSQKNITEKDLEIADKALQHIFVGQPAYPPYFCGDDINWNSRPVKDMEWVWQLNRMYFWDALARVYDASGEEKYAEAWCQQLVDWVRKNPRDDQHAYAWRSIEAGIRGHSWTSLFQYFIDSPNFTAEVLVTFLNSCFDHATYLMTQYRTGSNWGLMEAEGLAFIAMTFPEFRESKEWQEEGIRRLNNEIKLQVYPDGHQRELAIGYHLGCIGWFMRTYEMAKMNNLQNVFSSSYLQQIEKMCAVLMKIGLPDGTNAQFGDAWAGEPGQHKDRFMNWAQLFDRQDFLYLATDGREGKKPDSTAYALINSGLYSMRSSWEKSAICMVLKCGPDGGGHCQPDNGTFELYAGGRNLMPDAGSYIYSGDPENRAWFRQTKVHQTLTLNGQNTRYAPKLLLWNPSDSVDILVVENAGYEDLTHRRTVFFVDKRYFILIDEAYGNGQGNVDLHFQFAPGEAIFDQKNLSVSSGFDAGWNVQIQCLKQKNLILEREEGQVSFVYTKKQDRPAFRYRLNKDSEKSVHFVTLLTPYLNSPPNIEVMIPEPHEPGLNHFSIEVSEQGKTSKLSYEIAE